MEKTKRNLKCCSFVAIAVGVISVIRIILGCIFDNGMLRETVEQSLKEANESIELASVMMTIVYVMLGISATIALLLNLYIGICGLRIANGTYRGKAFMFWLVVMIAFGVFDIVSTIGSGGEAAVVIGSLITPIILVCNLIEIFICARKIRSAN